MSCPNATAPINISLGLIKGKCDYKCSFSFNYNNSSCIAINRGDYISLSYDTSSSPAVYYNSVGYNVKEIRIYIPSLHAYSGNKANGELIIVHTSNMGSPSLLVCIPIKSNTSSSSSSNLFKTVIDSVANTAPRDGETVVVNIPKYNLNNIVPNKPFFSYTATEPYQPCNGEVDYIVYDPLTAYLDILPETLTKLQTIISSNPYTIKKGPNLFYNEKGPNKKGTAGSEIYIDCQPISNSKEEITIINSETTGSFGVSLEDIWNNPILKFLFGSIIFIILLYITKYLLTILKPAKGKIIDNNG
jgi:carbonic anhydrase